jgi:hypothetical protein
MKTLALVLALFSAIVFVVAETNAQIYKWVDKDGVPHFSNVPTATEDRKPEPYAPEIRPPVKKCIPPKKNKFNSFLNPEKKDYWDEVEYRKCLSSGGISDDDWR